MWLWTDANEEKGNERRDEHRRKRDEECKIERDQRTEQRAHTLSTQIEEDTFLHSSSSSQQKIGFSLLEKYTHVH